MNPLLLHVIHGALCGGCYAVSPLVDTVVKDGFGASLHGGGLWDRSTRSTPEQCHDIPPHDQRLTTLRGMSLGAAYQQKLLNDPQLTFWSRPTITAMLAAGTLRSGADLAMLHAIQVAHDMHGHGVVDTVVLVDLAWDPGLLKHAFRGAFHASRVHEHIEDTRRWMSPLGLGGFPGVVLQRGDSYVHVPHEACDGKPGNFAPSPAKAIKQRARSSRARAGLSRHAS